MAKVECLECGAAARLVSGDVIYPRRPDLYGRHYWLCRCGAYCGCHGNTSKPLGYPCGPETRKARNRAHAAFDPLWQAKQRKEGVSRKEARGAGYRWLADQLGMRPEHCHIGMMTAEQANRVVQVIEMARGKAEPDNG